MTWSDWLGPPFGHGLPVRWELKRLHVSGVAVELVQPKGALEVRLFVGEASLARGLRHVGVISYPNVPLRVELVDAQQRFGEISYSSLR